VHGTHGHGVEMRDEMVKKILNSAMKPKWFVNFSEELPRSKKNVCSLVAQQLAKSLTTFCLYG
jgi:hypothetical protein